MEGRDDVLVGPFGVARVRAVLRTRHEEDVWQDSLTKQQTTTT